jgi:hypothetical protein
MRNFVQLKFINLAISLSFGFRLLGHGFKRLWLHLAVAVQQNLDFTFGTLKLLAAGVGKVYPFLEKTERPFKRDFALFEFANDLL